MHYAIAGVDVGYLRELITALFGEVEKEEVFTKGQFEDVTTCKQKREADATFVDSGEPSEKKVYASTLPIPMELGVPHEDLPKCEQVLEKKDKGKEIVSHIYYFCNFCTYKNRNRTTAVTHVHRDHLLNKLCCCLCPYSAWSADPLEKHILTKHDGCLEEGALTEQEALATVSSLNQ